MVVGGVGWMVLCRTLRISDLSVMVVVRVRLNRMRVRMAGFGLPE